MIQQLQMFRTFVLAMNAKRKSEEGATAVEYGLMVGLIAVVIIGTVFTLGGQLDQLFQRVVTELQGPAAP
jgi:pilus assembly protein Flp/PilA